MTAAVELYIGPARSGRHAALCRELTKLREESILVLPTEDLVRFRTAELIHEWGWLGVWDRRVCTFLGLVRRLLRDSAIDSEPVSEWDRRLLVEAIAARITGSEPVAELGDAIETQGFVNHVLRVITQLKQAAVEPGGFWELVAKRESAYWLDRVVADVYAAYQDALKEKDAYDLVGLYWEADVHCREMRSSGLDGISTIALDGFDDFTASEFRLIETLATRVDTLIFSMHCDEQNPSRRDLYATPLDTMKRIRERFTPHVREFAEIEPETATEYVASELFWRDKRPEPPSIRANLTLSPSGDAVHEIESIARSVKGRLLDGAAPDDIAVAFRQLDRTAAIVRRVFNEFGVPYQMSQRLPLMDTAVARFVLRLLDAGPTWERHAVVEVLASPYFAPSELQGHGYKTYLPTLARAAQIMSGRREWRARLARIGDLIERDDAGTILPVLERVSDPKRVLDETLAAVETFDDVFSAIQSARGALGMIEQFDAALDSLRVQDAFAKLDEPDRTIERESFQRIREILGALHDWYSYEDSKALELSDLAAKLHQAFQDASVRCPDYGGGVWVGDLESLRHLRFQHVYLAGVNEGEAPRPFSPSAIYAEEDLRFFARHGVTLDDARARANRERILFHHALDAAEDGLEISWRTEGMDGREAMPSPFIAAVEELLPNMKPETAAPSTIVPAAGRIASGRDLANVIFVHGIDEPPKFDSVLMRPRRGAAIEDSRQARRPPNRFDGVITDEALAAAIGERFGRDHLFSVDQLETYAECPFQFFVKRVLNIPEEEEPDAEFDRRLRGMLLHRVLQHFFERHRGEPIADIVTGAAVDELAEILDDVFDSHGWQSIATPDALREVERRRLLDTLTRHLPYEQRLADDWTAGHFEVSFGRVKERSADSLNTDAPFVLDTDEGPIQFAGKIDRIDTDNGAARIVDYKTSIGTKRRHIEDGLSLQLSLYNLALEHHLLSDLQCNDALFVRVGREKKLEWISSKNDRDEKKAELQELAREKVAEYVRGIRAAYFPPVPVAEKHCYVCKRRLMCRYEKARMDRKAEGA